MCLGLTVVENIDPPLIVEINAVVADYVLREEYSTKKRAEICKCGSCKGMHEDAIDRLNWAAMRSREYKRWRNAEDELKELPPLESDESFGDEQEV